MKAWVVRRLGPPDSMVMEEIDEGPPPLDKVRIAIESAAVNFPDALLVAGNYQVKPELPFVVGLEVSGTVLAAPAGAKVELCRQLGADLAVNYKEGDFVEAVKQFTGGAGADVIYDPVGGDVYDRSTKCIAFEGRLVVVGFTSGRIPTAAVNHALVKNY